MKTFYEKPYVCISDIIFVAMLKDLSDLMFPCSSGQKQQQAKNDSNVDSVLWSMSWTVTGMSQQMGCCANTLTTMWFKVLCTSTPCLGPSGSEK